MQQPPHRRIGLIVAGPTRHGIFASVPALRMRLGPIVAASARVASRAANALRHGWPAQDAAELFENVILLAHGRPEDLLALFEALFAAYRNRLDRHLVILADVAPCPRLHELLSRRGLSTAQAATVASHPPVVLVNAPRKWRRHVETLLAAANARTLFLNEPPLTLYQDVSSETGEMARRLQTRLRAAGLPRHETKLLAAMIWGMHNPSGRR
ncbi:MAG: hypothetical protein R2762_15590 [Bryobacteraceae bacterium]